MLTFLQYLVWGISMQTKHVCLRSNRELNQLLLQQPLYFRFQNMIQVILILVSMTEQRTLCQMMRGKAKWSFEFFL